MYLSVKKVKPLNDYNLDPEVLYEKSKVKLRKKEAV